jgi:hypothetical protein
MLFIIKIAESLGQTIEWVLRNVTDIELEAWAKYYEWVNKQQKPKGK